MAYNTFNLFSEIFFISLFLQKFLPNRTAGWMFLASQGCFCRINCLKESKPVFVCKKLIVLEGNRKKL